MEVTQLRNMYKKTGFSDLPGAVNKRGFGFIHDGTVDNLFSFLDFPGFIFPGGEDQQRDLEAFLLSFDTGMAPSVGFQITFDGTNHTATATRLGAVSSTEVIISIRRGGRKMGLPQ